MSSYKIIPEFKALAKVAPNALESLITADRRTFVRMKFDAEVPLSVFGAALTTRSGLEASLADSVVTGANGAFAAALTTTPPMVLTGGPTRGRLSNCEGLGVSSSTDLGIFNNKVTDLPLRPGLNIYNIFRAAANVPATTLEVPGLPTIARFTIVDELRTYLASATTMFGHELAEGYPMLAQVHFAPPTDVNEIQANAAYWPSKVLSMVTPNVKWMLISVPYCYSYDPYNARSPEGYIDVPKLYQDHGPEGAENYLLANAVSLEEMTSTLAKLNVPLPARSSPQGAGKGGVVSFAVPIVSDGLPWTRVWLRRVGDGPNPFVEAVTMYQDPLADPSLPQVTGFHKPPASAVDTVAVLGDVVKGLDGQALDASALSRYLQRTNSPAALVVQPLFGFMGGVPVTCEYKDLTVAQTSYEFDEFPGKQITIVDVQASVVRAAMRVDYNWYERYYKTGFGIYQPRASNIQANTLKSWNDAGLVSMGIVMYGEATAVSGALIDGLDIRRDYKRAKEKACETDDFDKQPMTPQMTWGAARAKLDAKKLSTTFFAPVVKDPSVPQEKPTLEQIDFRVANGGLISVQRTGTALRTVSVTQAVADLETAIGEGVIVNLNDWIPPNWSTAEIMALREANAVIEDAAVFASLDNRYIGVALDKTYAFPWESLSKSGYPVVREMPAQFGRMAIINSVCLYEANGRPLITLLGKLGSAEMTLKINAASK